MAVKKSRRRRNGDSAERKKRKRALLAAQLAPAEEAVQKAVSADGDLPAEEAALLEPGEDFIDGSIILDVDHIPIPRQIIQPEGGDASLHPVFIVALTIALAFIALIAYLIHLESY